MGINKIIDKTTAPKETNRQIGPLFKNWIDRGTIGCAVTKDEKEFLENMMEILYLIHQIELCKHLLKII